MRRSIMIWMKEGDKLVASPATIWINETPPESRRGRKQRQKNRKYKREKMARLEEDRQAAPEGRQAD